MSTIARMQPKVFANRPVHSRCIVSTQEIMEPTQRSRLRILRSESRCHDHLGQVGRASARVPGQHEFLLAGIRVTGRPPDGARRRRKAIPEIAARRITGEGTSTFSASRRPDVPSLIHAELLGKWLSSPIFYQHSLRTGKPRRRSEFRNCRIRQVLLITEFLGREV